MAKIVSAREAVSTIRDGMTLGIGGFGSYGPSDELLEALACQYAETGHPSRLTVVAGISGGNNKPEDIGFNRLKAPGLLDTIIAGHLGNAPCIANMVGGNEIAGFTIPLGVVMHLYRAIAGKKPGVLTHIGLGTFADPRVEGCKANDKAREQAREVVSLVEMEGREYLFYPSFHIDACLIRGTYADEDGNITMWHEALTDAQLELASAVHNGGGTVIVQVEGIVKRGTIPPKEVRIHNSLVDYIVKARPGNHLQGYACSHYRPELTGEVQVPTDALPPMPLDIRKVIARRAAIELRPGCLINLGIGIPSGIANVANEEGIANQMTLSLESGPVGGIPVDGVGFAAAVNAEAIYSICDTFDLYDGGVLDMTFLGAAEIDRRGNVNVSRFGTRCTGPGGFINISQNARRVFYVGAFTSGKLEAEIANGKLKIVQEGTGVKFVDQVQQITFSADYANESGQEVMYITERAVFRLTPEGPMLVEIAPGIDLERDILLHMAFHPILSPELKQMDARIFRAEPMGLHL
ncbi:MULTISPECIES: acyl CoA:acetate/3-ketoacid CoA transferase [Intestinimonas]|uniref:acyl CoA:acetate/3-ketoacid CoA transferase n=1 Tax=Intestinimonas TaxID=1392389 RepID=UPI00067E9416|nr:MULTISPECIES: CoA-transferase [Intestinimonas]MBS6283301.1 3-oxoacid CoA-transferase [Oscillospiraceae bacterium]